MVFCAVWMANWDKTTRLIPAPRYLSARICFFFQGKVTATVTEYGKSPASPSCLYSGVGTHVLISHPELRHDGA